MKRRPATAASATAFLFASVAAAFAVSLAAASDANVPVASPGARVPASQLTADDRAVPRYAHVFVIFDENKSFGRIIDSPDAPRISALAKAYGSASSMFGEVHPSEGNYVATIGGSTFGIHDDDAWYCVPGSTRPNCKGASASGYAAHSTGAPSLPSQLRAKGLDWRGYFGSIPAPGSLEVHSSASGTEAAQLYAAKHNPFVTFSNLRGAPDFAAHTVGLDTFYADIAANRAPAFSFIVPNQCDDMHGLGPDVGGPVPADCGKDAALIRRGDAATGRIVDAITTSPLWKSNENNAIVITFDEDDHTVGDVQGCCGFEPGSAANFGGGRIPTVVITNHGPRGVVDPTPYNHYSLLRTLEDAFGIYEYVGLAAATGKGVKPMLPLFEVNAAPTNIR